MKVDELIQLIKQGNLSPYQLYGVDLDFEQFESCLHYVNTPNDTVEKKQKLTYCVIDIELYQGDLATDDLDNDFVNAKFPVNSVSLYDSKNNTAYLFVHFLTNDIYQKFKQIEDIKQDYFKKLKELNFNLDNLELKILEYQNQELQLLTDLWTIIHKIDPVLITGWNCGMFDLPYLYKRILKLTNNEQQTCSIMSKFNVVKEEYNNDSKLGLIKIPDYVIADLMYFYKPRDEGGLNYGNKQASYSLDWVSTVELGLKKIEYKDTGLSLDKFYEQDPVNFFFYNLVDSILVHLLEEKLQFFSLHNDIRRIMKVPYDYSLRGSSALFDTFTLFELMKNKQLPRFNIAKEQALTISVEEQKQLPLPKSGLFKDKLTSKKKRQIKYETIDQRTYLKYISKYPGAYVKSPPKRKFFYEKKDGLIADLDASSLYPSMILQHNIGFDTYYGRILDPLCYKFINVLDKFIKEQNIPDIVLEQLAEWINKYVKTIEAQNMTDAITKIYIICTYLVKKLINYKRSIFNLFKPQNINDYKMLKIFLLPLLDLISDIHPDAREYNTFAYNYLLLNKYDEPIIYIVENENDPKVEIISISPRNLDKYLKERNISLTLSGTLFYRPEVKKSIFFDFLTSMKQLRNQFKKIRDSYSPDSAEYQDFDRKQLAVKILMNTSYGLYGLSTFRYSNKWLARTITTQGRFSLKLAQIVAEKFLTL